MEKYEEGGLINIGGGRDVSIRELAEAIRRVSGFTGEICYDTTQPDGIAVRLLDNSRITSLGWQPRTDFEEGLRATYEWFKEHEAGMRARR